MSIFTICGVLAIAAIHSTFGTVAPENRNVITMETAEDYF